MISWDSKWSKVLATGDIPQGVGHCYVFKLSSRSAIKLCMELSIVLFSGETHVVKFLPFVLCEVKCSSLGYGTLAAIFRDWWGFIVV